MKMLPPSHLTGLLPKARSLAALALTTLTGCFFPQRRRGGASAPEATCCRPYAHQHHRRCRAGHRRGRHARFSRHTFAQATSRRTRFVLLKAPAKERKVLELKNPSGNMLPTKTNITTKAKLQGD